MPFTLAEAGLFSFFSFFWPLGFLNPMASANCCECSCSSSEGWAAMAPFLLLRKLGGDEAASVVAAGPFNKACWALSFLTWPFPLNKGCFSFSPFPLSSGVLNSVGYPSDPRETSEISFFSFFFVFLLQCQCCQLQLAAVPFLHQSALQLLSSSPLRNSSIFACGAAPLLSFHI